MATRKKTIQEEVHGIELKEFGIALGQIADEKGISEERVVETVEAAIAAAYKKDYGKRGQNIRAEFDREMGSARFFLVKEVVDETMREFPVEGEEEAEGEGVETERGERKAERNKESADEEERLPRFNPERDLTIAEAQEKKKDVKVGDIIEEELESHDTFGRVAAQTAKQVIIQKIREAEREAMYREYKDREGEIVSGTIERIEGRTVFVNLGKSTGVLPPMEQIPSGRYRIGNRIRVLIASVEADPRGYGITLSRARGDLVKKLFELEVPEIFSGTVMIKAIAREAGVRTKIAVASDEEGVDPIGSCVGQKGTRVQAVIDEVGGEKIDIIEWSDNAEKFITAAISPAKIISVTLNPDDKRAEVLVPPDQLSIAIGRQGQNVRLAGELTGWRIDVSIEEGKKEKESEVDEKEKETKRKTITEEVSDGTKEADEEKTDEKEVREGGEEAKKEEETMEKKEKK